MISHKICFILPELFNLHLQLFTEHRNWESAIESWQRPILQDDKLPLWCRILICRSPNKHFIWRVIWPSRDVYLDLTVTASSSEYDEYRPLHSKLFRSPLVSFVYGSVLILIQLCIGSSYFYHS